MWIHVEEGESPLQFLPHWSGGLLTQTGYGRTPGSLTSSCYELSLEPVMHVEFGSL